MKENKIQKQNVGNAGEYYIASRLSALDYTVTITLGRAERYDILALSPKGRLIKISVKTTQKDKTTGFPLSQKDETNAQDDFYYAFVKLNGFIDTPDFWIIPSKVLCPLIRDSHKRWEILPGKNGQKHEKSNVRWLPITLTNADKKYYPETWEKEIEKYYKKLNQLI